MAISISVLVNLGRPWNGKIWYISRPFGRYGHFNYFDVAWCIVPISEYCTKEYLATLTLTPLSILLSLGVFIPVFGINCTKENLATLSSTHCLRCDSGLLVATTILQFFPSRATRFGKISPFGKKSVSNLFLRQFCQIST
jgi:hypothetical protein